MSNGVKLEGFDQFKRKLNNVNKDLQVKSLAVVTDLSLKWKGLAVNAAPVDQSAIRRGISSKVVTKSGNIVSAEVYSNAAHSRWMEFGTKSKKVVPGDLVAYESTLDYKKTGTWVEFVKYIKAWVERKGISIPYYAVALSIYRKGVTPHPFFFIHKAGIEQELKKRLKEVLG